MSNVKSIISCQNKAQISKPLNQPKKTKNNCNCRNKNSCPLEGDCNVWNIVYQAEVITPYSKETYIGLCDTTFKERYRNHTCSLRKESTKMQPSSASTYGGFKSKINYKIKWRKVKQARSYSNTDKKCDVSMGEFFL